MTCLRSYRRFIMVRGLKPRSLIPVWCYFYYILFIVGAWGQYYKNLDRKILDKSASPSYDIAFWETSDLAYIWFAFSRKLFFPKSEDCLCFNME